ncbi:hypothetical protein LX36DRAFT_476547 [Colletotrichum falcatum]|nr:hypothetical protein LX36DRAFT_476547 [Colletotrichum falcatum]
MVTVVVGSLHHLLYAGACCLKRLLYFDLVGKYNIGCFSINGGEREDELNSIEPLRLQSATKQGLPVTSRRYQTGLRSCKEDFFNSGITATSHRLSQLRQLLSCSPALDMNLDSINTECSGSKWLVTQLQILGIGMSCPTLSFVSSVTIGFRYD